MRRAASDENSTSLMHDLAGLLNPLPNYSEIQPITQELKSNLQHYQRRINTDPDISCEEDPAIKCLKVLCAELQDYYADLYIFER
jgi:hypothetical protein